MWVDTCGARPVLHKGVLPHTYDNGPIAISHYCPGILMPLPLTTGPVQPVFTTCQPAGEGQQRTLPVIVEGATYFSYRGIGGGSGSLGIGVDQRQH